MTAAWGSSEAEFGANAAHEYPAVHSLVTGFFNIDRAGVPRVISIVQEAIECTKRDGKMMLLQALLVWCVRACLCLSVSVSVWLWLLVSLGQMAVDW